MENELDERKRKILKAIIQTYLETVSISVGGFVKLAQQCIDQAGGMESQGGSEGPQEGTEVDRVSGATISSTAAVKGINAAYEFLQTID